MTSLFREDWCTESYRLTESDMSTGIAQFHTYDKKAKSRFLVALLSNESTLKKSLSPIQQLLDVACQDKDKWVNIVARLVNKQLECNEVHKNVIGESVSKVVDQLMTTKSCDEVNFDFFPQELKYLNADLYPSFQFDNVHCHHGGTIPSFMGNDRIESSAGSGISGPPASVPVRPPLMPSNSAPSYHSRPAPSAVSNQHRTSTATGAASAARQGSKQHAKILSMDDIKALEDPGKPAKKMKMSGALVSASSGPKASSAAPRKRKSEDSLVDKGKDQTAQSDTTGHTQSDANVK